LLQGKLVRLRAVEEPDAERFHKWLNDPEVTQFICRRCPISLHEEREWIRAHAQNPDNLVFAVETLDGVHIGGCGLDRVQQHRESRGAILGIHIGDKQYWGKGYGTDAVGTLLRFAFEELNLHRVALSVFEYNARAIRCYEKCGFQHEGREREAFFRNGRYWDILRMSVLQREFAALTQNANGAPGE
jgi:RimJ/RimL family protein N-acetyltransferase